jgi:hypothetical protein
MALWEYKVITSGKGGFATPALLEKFLNDLGRDEWEIVHFQTAAENFLAFTGLARRSTQRDWTLQDAAAAAAKAEAEKLRAEFEAKFKAAAGSGTGGTIEERAPSFLEEKIAPDDGFRKPVDTSHDDDPEAQEEDKADEWDKLAAAEEDDLPTFFEAIKPHMRRNQRGPGMSVGVDYLAKKWDQTEDDLKGALVECGFVMPADEDSKAEYVEYDGDLYWLNINRRGELWINTKEKPRPVFRPVKAARVEIETAPPKDTAGAKDEGYGASEAKPETGDRKPETVETAGEVGGAEPQTQNAKPQTARTAASLPQGPALLGKIRPHMRRNRRGPGGSGSTTFLSRALRTSEADLKTAFVTLGLTVPATPDDKPVYAEIGNELWWLNLDSRGGLWINGREKKEGESAANAKEAVAQNTSGDQALESIPGSAAPDAVPVPEIAPGVATASEFSSAALAVASVDETARKEPGVTEAGAQAAEQTPQSAESPAPVNPVLAAVRLLLKETKTGAIAGKVDRLADELGKPTEEFLATLVGSGLKVPEKPREKPLFVEHGNEILWLNKNAKGELWLNAKESKYADKVADADEGEVASEGGEGEATNGEKKPARRGGRPRAKKPE